MPFKDIPLKPGVTTTLTPTAAGGALVGSNLIRSNQGTVERVRGWERLSSNVANGAIRAMHPYQDLNSNKILLMGTLNGAQMLENDDLYTFQFANRTIILPFQGISSTANSGLVFFNITNHGVQVGDSVFITQPQYVGGIVLYPGSWPVLSVPNANQFTAAVFPPTTLATTSSPAVFNSSNGSSIITVFLPAHGLTTGQTFVVNFDVEYTTVGGLPGASTAAGSYTVTVLNSSQFQIDSGYPAIGNVTGFQYNLSGDTPLYVIPSTASYDDNWFLDNLGQNGLLCNTGGGIFQYTPPLPLNGTAVCVRLENSPTVNVGMFVAMPQAQIVAFGSEAVIGGGIIDPLLVRWCDAGQSDVWTADATNQAGSYRLSRGSKIIGGIQAPQSAMLWTDIDCWTMQYVGPDAVYSFSVVGSGCGLISPKARAVQGRNTYWMSRRGFFVFGDSGVRPISCPVWDTIFDNLDQSQVDRIWAWSNSTRTEIWFFYPSSEGTGEIDSYVKMNTLDGSWDYGSLIRTSGIDESVWGLPLAADQNYRVQQHEVGFDADGVGMSGAYAATGFVALAEGDLIAFIDELQPDLKWLGTGGSVNVTIYAQTTPSSPIEQFGPYSVTDTTERVPLRIRARQVALRYDWTDTTGYSARVGLPRIRIQQSGRAP